MTPAARLIHLNGPTGVGKSTVSAAYAAAHPGTLNLDQDKVLALVGGWEEHFWDYLPHGRELAKSLARTHLASGRDVLLPQLVTDHHEAAGFARSAQEVGASYVEVALTVRRATLGARHRQRLRCASDPVTVAMDRIVAAGGGDRLLAKIQDDFDRYLTSRPEAIRIDTSGQSLEETVRALGDVLAARREQPEEETSE